MWRGDVARCCVIKIGTLDADPSGDRKYARSEVVMFLSSFGNSDREVAIIICRDKISNLRYSVN